MKITIEAMAPTLKPWVEHLVDVWPAYLIKPQFASWEVFHIISLVVLGGTSILMNLRLLGVGLGDERPSEVYRNLRRWQDIGVIGIVVSGVLIGMANAERLYASTAFVVKMLALASGVVLTYGASRPVARAEGSVGGSARIFLCIGLALWLAGVWIFATGVLINPGLFHVLTAAGLILLLVTRGRLRVAYLVGLILLIGAQQWVTHVTFGPDDRAHLDPANKAFAYAFAAWMLGAAGLQAFGRTDERGFGPLTRLIGFASILAWVTAAAAGRWIAFA